MSNVGFATLSIIPSAKGFGTLLGKETDGELKTQGGKGGKAFGGTFGSALKSMAGPLAAVFGTAAIGGFVKSAISAAGDLQQSIGAIDAIFKGSASQMHSWSANAATTVGLTKNEFNELGTLIGAQLKNGGTAMDALAPKTNDLIGLGADLASMFGGTTKDAVGALSSALKGERDPIEKYGVSLKQATIDAKAAELGFTKVGGSLSNEAQQAATLALIMEQTADAHGNFGRESDTLAHKQQVLSALWSDGKARIGTELLPAITALTGGLIGMLGPAIDGIVGGMQWAGDAIKLFSGTLSGAGADVDLGGWTNPIIAFAALVGDTVGNIVAVFAPLGPVFAAAFGGLGGQLAEILPMFSPFGLILQALMPVLPQIAGMIAHLAAVLGPVLGDVLATVTPMIGMLVDTLTGVFVAILPTVIEFVGTLAGVFASLWPVIASVLAAVVPLVMMLVEKLAPIFISLVQNVLPPVATILGVIVAAVAPLVEILLGYLIPVIESLMPIVETVFGAIAGIISGVMTAISGIIQIVMGLISGDWDMVWAGIKDFVSGIWDAISAVVVGAINLIGGVINYVLTVISSAWNSTWSAIGDFLRNSFSTMVTATSTALGDIGQFFYDLPGNIMKALSGIGTWLVQTGKDLIDGFLKGISSMGDAIWKAISAPIEGAIDGVKNLLGIKSPSRVFMQIGHDTGAGMALGLKDAASLVEEASLSLVPSAPSFRSPSLSMGVTDALALVAEGRGDSFTVEYNDHSTSTEDKQAKLLSAQTALEQSVAARRS